MPPTIERQDLATTVYDVLRQRISTLVLVPGQRIDIPRLGAELDISAIPIREALKRLVERKLVDVKPNVGYTVARLTDEDIAELFTLRRLLEVKALEESIRRITPEELEDVKIRCERLLTRSQSPRDIRLEFCDTDLFFHQQLIVGRCGNSLLVHFYDVLSERTSFTIHVSGRVKESTEEHLKVIGAMQQSDLDFAKAMLLEHLYSCEKTCISLPQSEEAWIQKREEVFGSQVQAAP